MTSLAPSANYTPSLYYQTSGTAVTNSVVYTVRWSGGATGNASVWQDTDLVGPVDWEGLFLERRASRLVIPKAVEQYELPDGATLHVDDQGNYRIDDRNAKVIYAAHRLREFSPHVNASDLVAQFIEYVGKLGVRRRDVPHLPLNLFVHWLIVEAAERDQDPLPQDVVPLPNNRLLKSYIQPHCAYTRCRRFIRRDQTIRGVGYCAPVCATRHLTQVAG